MEEIIAKTGENGFHFVDEAAPPALMRALALEILKRKLVVTWWTNIRFEKNFTKDLCLLLKASGCIAVSGGLEVASDRLLALIDKGVTVEQVAQVTLNFTEANIMVHAYLMYGYPTQTTQETIDSLEMVRQLFELGIIQSGFWHQFALTSHSPIYAEPTKYGIIPVYNPITFANNDVRFTDKTGLDHSKFSFGLKKSIFNFMHGIGFDIPLQEWFDFKIPQSTIHPHFIEDCLTSEENLNTKISSKIVWLGGEPSTEITTKNKRGTIREIMHLTFYFNSEEITISTEKDKGIWLTSTLKKLNVQQNETQTFATLKSSFELTFENFELFWYSKPINTLRNYGLLAL
jgi:hypothetical protein